MFWRLMKIIIKIFFIHYPSSFYWNRRLLKIINTLFFLKIFPFQVFILMWHKGCSSRLTVIIRFSSALFTGEDGRRGGVKEIWKIKWLLFIITSTRSCLTQLNSIFPGESRDLMTRRWWRFTRTLGSQWTP